MTRSLTSIQHPVPLMKSLVPLTFLVALICIPPAVQAQPYGSASRTVSVSVSTITNVAVTGNVSLTIGLANVTAGVDLMGPVTSTATSLLWGINSSLKKISVRGVVAVPPQKYILKVLAVSPTTGTAAPEVTVSTTDTDFMTNVGRSSGTCTLQYSGYALASKGTGSDSYTITFTIATQ
ncbi:MAG: hypothetical protein NTU47_15220 [Ignavibacteriales bacterium]|nr:hypothetical protein [Ignavibacteriales bacterium]